MIIKLPTPQQLQIMGQMRRMKAEDCYGWKLAYVLNLKNRGVYVQLTRLQEAGYVTAPPPEQGKIRRYALTLKAHRLLTVVLGE